MLKSDLVETDKHSIKILLRRKNLRFLRRTNHNTNTLAPIRKQKKMTSHKPLKSISHNFGHSFISLMNYINDDYFLGHLLKQVRKKNLNRLEIDILKNTAEPMELLTKPIIESIGYWNKWFPTLVENSGSSMDFVKSATMTIEFDLTKNRQYENNKLIIENPFTCDIIITDDRGKIYKNKHEGWWFPETI